jgi:hypothetical protein
VEEAERAEAAEAAGDPAAVGPVDRGEGNMFGMTRHRLQKFLFFLVPARQTFVVRGDDGIHARCRSGLLGPARRGDVYAFSTRRVHTGSGFRYRSRGRTTTHFPYDAKQDVNELPDDVDLS